jgi:hypothetical protein
MGRCIELIIISDSAFFTQQHSIAKANHRKRPLTQRVDLLIPLFRVLESVTTLTIKWYNRGTTPRLALQLLRRLASCRIAP